MWRNDVSKASAAFSSRRNLRGPSPLTPLPVGEGDKCGAFLTPRDKVPDICGANSGMMGSEGVLS
jgi:hypothetical protein